MDSLRNVPGLLRQYRSTVIFCAATLVAVLLGGFTERGDMHRFPWPMGRIPVLYAGGCPLTGCDCIDDCLAAVYGPSGGSSSVGFKGTADVIFERNVGQVDSRYEFVAQGASHSIRLSPTQAVFNFPGTTEKAARQIRATIEGAQMRVRGQAQEPLGGRVNYLRGNDPKKWLTDIPTFGRVTFPGIYPGIDLAYHGSAGQVESDFIVNPGADPSRIRINFDGSDQVRLESDGSLTIAAGEHRLRWRKPSLYQATATGRKKPVEGRFRQDDDKTIGFEVGLYDLRQPLIIDPVITYATYFGTPATEGAARVAADASGNAYIVGASDSGSFPISPGALNGSSDSIDGGLRGDVIVAKLNAAGNQMVFTTHLGGGNSNTGVGIALDSSGNIYLTGLTASSDFPHTTDLTTKAILTNENCFVTKLNPSASQIIYSTLIGGSSHDGCNAIGLDSAGNAYVVGGTMSTDFPTVNAVQTTLKGSSANMYNINAFAAKLSADGTKLLYSTYLGGNAYNLATAVAVDGSGNAYLTGYTTSTNFPVTSGVYQSTYAGSGGQYDNSYSVGDAFVVKMSPTGTLVYSTYLGGTKDDMGIGIAIDGQGNAYVGGATLSSNFPTMQPFQAAYGGYGGETSPVTLASGDIFYGGDGFIAELNPTGTALVFSSYLGGSLDDRVTGIVVDSTGNIWVTGQTLSQAPSFPITPNATQATNAGDNGGGQAAFQLGDAFLTEISASHTIAFSTFLGGSSADWGGGLALDGQGGVIVAGGTASSNFPATQGALQTKYGGIDPTLPLPVGDAFIARWGGAVAVPTPAIAGFSSAASYASGSVAPGEALLIAGTLIGPTTLATAQLTPTGAVSTMVANTQFLFNGIAAPIVYVSSGYSTVIVPYELAGKTSAQLVAVYNGVSSPAVTVPVTAALPAIFTADASGRGPAAVINPDSTINTANNPAARGSTVAFYVTGEGQTNPGGVDGSVTGTVIPPALPVSVSIGGVSVTSFQFLGEAPGEVAGVLQINVTIPTTASAGVVPLTVTVGSATSQSGVTIAIK
jgi:uncharacterized protein (TIGR03437 family)